MLQALPKPLQHVDNIGIHRRSADVAMVEKNIPKPLQNYMRHTTVQNSTVQYSTVQAQYSTTVYSEKMSSQHCRFSKQIQQEISLLGWKMTCNSRMYDSLANIFAHLVRIPPVQGSVVVENHRVPRRKKNALSQGRVPALGIV